MSVVVILKEWWPVRAGARASLVMAWALAGLPYGGPAAAQALAQPSAQSPTQPGAAAASSSIQVLEILQAASALPSWADRLSTVVGRHPQVQAASADLQQQQSQVEAARAGWRPQVRAGLSAGRAQSGSNAQSTTVNAQQLLYDFGRLDGRINEASALREQRLARLLQAVDDAALEGALVLLELERQTALALEARRLTEALDEVVRLTRLRAQAGAATQVDPTIAQARRDGAQLTELGVRSRLEQARSRWQTLSGDRNANAGPQAGPWPLDLAPSSPSPSAAQGPMTPWGPLPEPEDSRFFDEAPTLRAALQDVEAARAALEVVKASRLPSVTLDASMGRPLDRSLLLTNRNDTSLTVNLSAPIYQGGAGEAQVRAAVAALQAAQSRLDAARRAVQERWRDAELQLMGALARMPSLQQRLLGYNDSRRLYREQYLQLGNRSILDFLNAEQELYLSRTELLNAEYDARQSKLQSLHAAGQLRSFFDLRVDTTGLSP